MMIILLNGFFYQDSQSEMFVMLNRLKQAYYLTCFGTSLKMQNPLR